MSGCRYDVLDCPCSFKDIGLPYMFVKLFQQKVRVSPLVNISIIKVGSQM